MKEWNRYSLSGVSDEHYALQLRHIREGTMEGIRALASVAHAAFIKFPSCRQDSKSWQNILKGLREQTEPGSGGDRAARLERWSVAFPVRNDQHV